MHLDSPLHSKKQNNKNILQADTSSPGVAKDWTEQEMVSGNPGKKGKNTKKIFATEVDQGSTYLGHFLVTFAKDTKLGFPQPCPARQLFLLLFKREEKKRQKIKEGIKKHSLGHVLSNSQDVSEPRFPAVPSKMGFSTPTFPPPTYLPALAPEPA